MPTPTPSPSIASLSATFPVPTAVWLVLLMALCGGGAFAILRGRRLERVPIFGALISSILMLVALASAVWFVALLMLGLPRIPQPKALTLEEVAGIVQIGLGVAAAVGATVALLVAYRKQRDTESVREADKFTTAVEQMGHDSLFVRIAAVHALRDLADQWPQWRQRALDIMCIALVRVQDGDDASQAELRREIQAVIRSRFASRKTDWIGSDIVLAHGRLSAGRLSGLHLNGGSIQLRDLTISDSVDMSGIVLSAGSRLSIDNISVTGSLDASSMRIERNGAADMQRVALSGGAVLDTSSAEVAESATLRYAALSLSGESKWLCSELEVRGEVAIDEVELTGGASIDLEEMECTNGRFSLINVRLTDASIRFRGIAARGGAYVRLFDWILERSTVSFAGSKIEQSSVFFLSELIASDGSSVGVQKVYNKSGSLFYVYSTSLGCGINFDESENEGAGSTFILRVWEWMPGGRVAFPSGGNYGGDVHLRFGRPGKTPPAVGTVSYGKVRTRDGFLELVRFADTKLVREPDAIGATPALTTSDHDWRTHLDKSPLGVAIRYDGGLEQGARPSPAS